MKKYFTLFKVTEGNWNLEPFSNMEACSFSFKAKKSLTICRLRLGEQLMKSRGEELSCFTATTAAKSRKEEVKWTKRTGLPFYWFKSTTLTWNRAAACFCHHELGRKLFILKTILSGLFPLYLLIEIQCHLSFRWTQMFEKEIYCVWSSNKYMKGSG